MDNNNIKLTTFSKQTHHTNYYLPNNASDTTQNNGDMSGRTVSDVRTVKFTADKPKSLLQDNKERVNSGKKVSFSSKLSYCSNSNKKEGLKWLLKKQSEVQYKIKQNKLAILTTQRPGLSWLIKQHSDHNDKLQFKKISE